MSLAHTHTHTQLAQYTNSKPPSTNIVSQQLYTGSSPLSTNIVNQQEANKAHSIG